ncbi:MAG: hypothetical protein HYV07_05930 [Deltaproteobacteria bacterium]|nr:hypothetical protein [Deltaproteobacteria bacterium]
MDLRSAVEAAASRHAIAAGLQSVAQIAPSERASITQKISKELGVDPRSVQFVLGVHWNETSGLAGAKSNGAFLASASSAQRRSVAQNGTSAFEVRANQMKASAQVENSGERSEPAGRSDPRQTGGLADGDSLRPGAAKSGQKPLERAERIDAALEAPGPSTLSDSAPLELRTKIARRNVALDQHVIQPGLYDAPDRKPRTGEYGQIRLKDLEDSDPLLDTRFFRGMGSADPAVHALRLTGKLIPPGTSGDYEAFKTYSHKEPLDAYEWTLDPYVALKGTAGHGCLVSVSLRELKAQGVKEVFRKVGDTEGGLFVAAMFEPKAREVGHSNGAYELSATSPKVEREGADNFARALAQKVPDAGGWDEYLESGAKGALPMKKAAVSEIGKQLLFFHRRLETLKPSSPLLEKARLALIELKEAEVDQRLEGLRNLSRNLRSAVADLESKSLS